VKVWPARHFLIVAPSSAKLCSCLSGQHRSLANLANKISIWTGFDLDSCAYVVPWNASLLLLLPSWQLWNDSVVLPLKTPKSFTVTNHIQYLTHPEIRPLEQR
jgi:hypothetical protein